LEQPYVHGVEWNSSLDGVTHDVSRFRMMPPREDESLLDWQARYLGVSASHEPWLSACGSWAERGQVFFARSSRYHNGVFPWARLVGRYPKARFIGTAHEHAEFQRQFRCRLAHPQTASLLDVANLMACAELVAANQSCPFWIAAGLGVPVIQETWEHAPNSIVTRANAVYVRSREDCKFLQNNSGLLTRTA
jgi:hypothetical protein